LVSYCRVLCHVDRQAGLPHGRSAGDDDEIAGLQARGHLVELFEARGYAGQFAFGVIEHIDAIDGRGQDALQLHDARTPLSALGQLEHALLRAFDELRCRAALRVVRAGRDLAADLDQPS